MKIKSIISFIALGVTTALQPLSAQTTSGSTLNGTQGTTLGQAVGLNGTINNSTVGAGGAGIGTTTTGVGVTGFSRGNAVTSTTTNSNNNNSNTTGASGGTTQSVTNNGNGNGNLSSFDRRWLSQAAAGSLHEITLGNLAQTNSSNADVQAFGARLLEDHTLSFQQAEQLATDNGTTVPTAETRSQQRAAQKLARLTGADFDTAFLNESVRGHIKDIQSYENEALRGRNADVRAYAREQLPILMDHLVTALELRELLGITTLR